MPTTLYPVRFQPLLRRYLWGGRRLETSLGKHSARQRLGRKLGNLRSCRGPEPRRVRAAPRNVAGRAGRTARRRVAGPESSAAAFPALVEVSRRGPKAFGPGSSGRCAGRPARSARSGQDRGLGHLGGRAGQPDLRRSQAGRRSPDAGGGHCPGALPGLPERLRAVGGRLHFSACRHGPRPGGRAAGGRGPAIERRHLPAVRLEPRGAGRQAAAPCMSNRGWMRSISSGDPCGPSSRVPSSGRE